VPGATPQPRREAGRRQPLAIRLAARHAEQIGLWGLGGGDLWAGLVETAERAKLTAGVRLGTIPGWEQAIVAQEQPRIDKPEEPSAGEVDLTGRTLGEFRILRKLGQGGMGQVYLAMQQTLKRQVALKLLKAELAANPTSLKRFYAEALAVATITHANIVQVYSIGQADGYHFMALEYVEGCTLRDYLTRKGPPDLPLALSIMRQTAAALQRASELGFVHRDIKPENILLTRKGEVKVADFGLSRCLSGEQQALNLTASGVAIGTPLYMSPEQVQGRPADPRSDIYSFGVTCYHMFAGHPPFRGESAFEVALQHVQSEPPPLGAIRPDLPPDLVALVHRMLAKSPDDRPQSCWEILRELARLREQTTTTTTGPVASTPTAPTGPTAAATVVPTGSGSLSQPPSTTQPTTRSGGSGALSGQAQAASSAPSTSSASSASSALPAPSTSSASSAPPPRLALVRFVGPARRPLPPPLAVGRGRASRANGRGIRLRAEAAELAPQRRGSEVTDGQFEGKSASDQEFHEKERILLSLIGTPSEKTLSNAGLVYRIDLGALYVRANRLDEAERFFKSLVEVPNPPIELQILAKIGSAVVVAYRDQPKESLTLLTELLEKEKIKLRPKAREMINSNYTLQRLVTEALDRNEINLQGDQAKQIALLRQAFTLNRAPIRGGRSEK
jgi:serine/threonine protein kinase